jgi:hypothetical protein
VEQYVNVTEHILNAFAASRISITTSSGWDGKASGRYLGLFKNFVEGDLFNMLYFCKKKKKHLPV